MISDLKPYPAMRDSGVSWLGEVPEHWDVSRAKTLMRPVDVRSESGAEELLTVSSARGVVPRRLTNVTMFKAESYAGHKLCWPGDLVINSLWAWSRGLGVSQYHGIVSTAYGVYRTRETGVLHPRFVHELVRSSSFHWEMRVRSKGVWTSRLQLTDAAFLGAPILLPPLPEQAAIVRFLDHADRRIRRYIRAKQKLVKLLEEQKQAIIHRAVTRGLDSGVPLKASGVEWLGEVPEHWEVLPLLAVARRKSISGVPQRELLSVYLDRGVIRFSEVREKRTNVTSEDLSRYQAVDPGDLVLNNQQAWRGSVGVSRHVGIVSPAYLVLALGNRFDADFADFLFRDRGMVTQYLVGSRGVGSIQRNLYWPSLRRSLAPVPPLAEQAEIARVLGEAIENIRAATTRTRREISLLRELRTRLIADVVTGKLDVRKAAARLPEEDGDTVDEADDLDQDDGALEDMDLDAELEEIDA